MMVWGLMLLLAAVGGVAQRPAAPSQSQTSRGACSPNVRDTKGTVTIIYDRDACPGIDPALMERLTQFVKEFPDTLKHLNELLNRKDEDLRQAVARADEWARKYRELSQRLDQQGADDELSRRAAALVRAGKLDEAGVLLDEILARDEKIVDRTAANHYNRGRSLELEFKPQAALVHYEKAHRYRPAEWRYALAFGRLLHEQNDYENAERAYEAALEELNPDRSAHLPDVAAVLNNLGTLYRETNRIAEATEALEDALGIGRWLNKTSSRARFLPALAATLDSLGSLYRETNKTKEAERAYREALTIRRGLARGSARTVYLPDVATTLDNMGTLSRVVNQLGTARVRYGEALAIRRELAEANRAAYLGDVAETLGHLGAVYMALRETAAAERVYTEALTIRRELATANRAAHLPDLADTLHDVAVFYRNTKRLPAAEGAYKEALVIRRDLARTNRAAYLPQVAATLHDLGLLYRTTHRLTEATSAFDEAVTLRKEFWSTNAVKHGDDLAASLMELVRTRRDEGDTGCALLREAFKAARSFERRGQANAGVRAVCPPS